MHTIFQGNSKITFLLAQMALKHTLDTVLYSSNQTSDMDSDSRLAFDKSLNDMREQTIDASDYSFAWIQDIARDATRNRVGNCCEKSCIAFEFLIKHPLLFDVNIELFNNPFSDHFFVVIGRDKDTPTYDPTQWNKNCIICDAWGDPSCYRIGSVTFDCFNSNKFKAIENLLYVRNERQNAFVLRQTILTNDSDLKEQDCLVLRSQSYQGVFQSFNHDIPMCFEYWDYPDSDLDSDLDDVELLHKYDHFKK